MEDSADRAGDCGGIPKPKESSRFSAFWMASVSRLDFTLLLQPSDVGPAKLYCSSRAHDNCGVSEERLLPAAVVIDALGGSSV